MEILKKKVFEATKKKFLTEVSSTSEKINLQVFDFIGDKNKAAEYGN